MALLKCKHCNYQWDYEGTKEHYATCPNCRYKVRITTEKIDGLHKRKMDLEIKKRYTVKNRPLKLIGMARIVNIFVKEHNYDESMLIQILLKLQGNFNWLPKEMIIELSKQLKIPLSQVYQAATFYKAFTLAPRGRHLIRVCMGTSCKVRGAQIILDAIERALSIGSGETTPDNKFSIETVNCIGCCALGPVITVDDEYHGNLKSFDIERILSEYE